MKGALIYLSEMLLVIVSCVVIGQLFGLSAFCGSIFGMACALKLFATKKEKQSFTIAEYYSTSFGWLEIIMQIIANAIFAIVAFFLYRHSWLIAFGLGWGLECEVRLISNVFATKIYHRIS